MTFSADFEILGKVDTIDLKEGGSEVTVTDENKEEYIKYVTNMLKMLLLK